MHSLKWKKPAQNNSDDSGILYRVRAAAAQMVYSMDAESLIQESLFLDTVNMSPSMPCGPKDVII